MPEILNATTNGNTLKLQLRGLPVQYVNALRRIILAEIPTVSIKDVQILINTSQLPWEMLKHRVEMLPVNVRPSEARIISETKLELRVPSSGVPQEITTRHFMVHGDRKDVLMKDDDDNYLLFLNLNADEEVHITARLGLDLHGASQVSTVSYGFHVDEETARADKEEYLVDVDEEEKEAAGREFDNFYIQKSYHRDESGQADWYDFFVESWGVVSPTEILRTAIDVLKNKIQDWAKIPITREAQFAVVSSNTETHTVGALVQRVMSDRGKTNRVMYDVPHELLSNMIVKFDTSDSPESVIDDTVEVIVGWCDTLAAQLSR
jgi:DNA-directed RNA polymerase subunit L